MKNASFSREWLSAALAKMGIAASDPLLVALSGGLDSTVLLHALSRLSRPALRAVHIDHGLQRQARTWSDQAVRKARDYGVACEVLVVKVRNRGQGWEAAARDARYEALASCLRPQEVLVVAHHANDQAETVLLQLLRGTGLAGGGMVAMQSFGRGWLARPLLDISRDALTQYAASEGLDFITDDSNTDCRFARNYIRHAVWPLIAKRWPKGHEALARGARLGREARELLQVYLDWDVRRCTNATGALLLPEFCALAPLAQAWVLRSWIQERGGRPPSERSCNAILTALRIIPRSRQQVLRLPGGGMVRRYRDRAFWGPSIEPPIAFGAWSGLWETASEYRLPGGQRLVGHETQGQGLRRDRLSGKPLVVSSRVPGARVFIPGRGHRSLKKLLQELGIAPWERAGAVFVFDAEALIAIPGYWICDQYKAGPLEPGLVLAIET